MKALLYILPFGILFIPSFATSDWTTVGMASVSDYRFVTSLAEGSRFIYVGTTGGLVRYDKVDERFLFPYDYLDVAIGGIINSPVKELSVSDNRLKVETSSGTYSFPVSLPFDSTSDDCPESFPGYIPPPGYFFRPDGVLSDMHLHDYPVTACLTDFIGNKFLGTWGKGLLRVKNGGNLLDLLPFGLASPVVDNICVSDDYTVFAGEGGITVWEREKDIWDIFQAEDIPSLPTDRVEDVLIMGDTVFFATEFGLVTLDVRKGRFKTCRPAVELTSLALVKDTLWAGTTDGIAVYSSDGVSLDILRRADFPRVNDVAYLDNTLWFATDYGVFTWNDKGFLRYTKDDGTLDASVISAKASADTLFFLSRKGIVAVPSFIDKPSIFPGLFIFNGRRIKDFEPVGRFFFFATSSGVALYDRKSFETRMLTTEEGLISNDVRMITREGKYLWFGTPKGASRFTLDW